MYNLRFCILCQLICLSLRSKDLLPEEETLDIYIGHIYVGHMYSDNATNFVRAEKVLKESIWK